MGMGTVLMGTGGDGGSVSVPVQTLVCAAATVTWNSLPDSLKDTALSLSSLQNDLIARRTS